MYMYISLSLSIRYTYGCALACMHVSLHVFLYITSIPTLMQMLCTHKYIFCKYTYTRTHTEAQRCIQLFVTPSPRPTSKLVRYYTAK